MQTTYEIPESRIDWFVKKIAQLNKKATKLGCVPVEIKRVGTITKNKGKLIYKCIVIEVHGEAPKFKGWSFIAVIQYVKTEKEVTPIIRNIAGNSVPEKYRTRGAVCDHCKHNRYRKDTYIIKNSDGEYKQVGKTCLKDFLGHTDPKSLAFMAELLLEVGELVEESLVGDICGGGFSYYSLQSYLAAVSAMIKKHGWISKRTAEDRMTVSTSLMAFNFLFPPTSRYNEEQNPDLTITDEDIKLAKDSIDWAKSLLDGETNDYQYNIASIAKTGIYNYRLMGYAASIVISYLKEKNEIKSKKETTNSEYVGTIRKRENFTVYIDRIIPIEGIYGITYLHQLHDEKGNKIVWFGSSHLREIDKIDVEEPLNVKATVKDHSIYNNVNQTIITRVKEV